MELMVQSVNEFSMDLFNAIYSSRAELSESLVFSSFSLVISLMMALAGTNKQTKQEILNTLKFDSLNAQKLHEEIKHLIDSVSVSSENGLNKLTIANKMILNNQEADAEFLSVIKNIYGAKVDLVNESNLIKVIDETNKWISELTNEKINKVLGEYFKCVSVALLNVIYFHYEWLHKFDKSLTEKEKFFKSPNLEIRVDMMMLHDEKRLPYYFSDELKAHFLTLPYQGDKFQFTVIFPNEENDFLFRNDQQSLVNKINFTILNEQLKKQSFKSVKLRMPRFKINNELELNQILQTLGIKTAFDRIKADFSGISKVDQLYIDQVIQQAFIEVNEVGTEAAAVTYIKIVKRSLGEMPFELTLNRPFVYLISEKKSGLIIFQGTYNGDEKSSNTDEEKRQEKIEL